MVCVDAKLIPVKVIELPLMLPQVDPNLPEVIIGPDLNCKTTVAEASGTVGPVTIVLV